MSPVSVGGPPWGSPDGRRPDFQLPRSGPSLLEVGIVVFIVVTLVAIVGVGVFRGPPSCPPGQVLVSGYASGGPVWLCMPAPR